MPTVMISSTIGDLANLRRDVHAAVDKAAVATAWLFEMHAVATGSPPEDQYLDLARGCDLYVLIVADQQSSPTEAEYETAHLDNPEKVLTFFVGNGSDEVRAFRDLLESRHTRVQRDAAMELVGPITDAVVDAVRSGRILRRRLIDRLDQRIERSRSLVIDVPAILEPRVRENGRTLAAKEFFSRDTHAALSGIGGSGKTLCAALSARRLAGAAHVLAIYAPCRPEVIRVEDLLQGALNAVRFHAGEDLLRRWCGDGRIFLVVDGLETLGGRERRQFLESARSWADTYPRCGVIVCARRFADGELEGFRHVAMAPLGDSEIRGLAQALGAGSLQIRFPAQVADIAQWPMWATALLVFGTETSTGLELLRSLVHARLSSAGMSSPLERYELSEAAGCLAFHLWPHTEAPVSQTLETLGRWGSDPVTVDRYESRSAENLLDRLANAGLVEVGEFVSFPHRLLATILAAQHSAREPSRASPVDDELAPFVAALLDDDDHVDALHELICLKDVFVLARYLRLSPARSRITDLERDTERMSRAVERWTPTGDHLEVAHGEGWVAWRGSSSYVLHDAMSDKEFTSWRIASDAAVSLWPRSPFIERTPEFVAAVYVLSRYRMTFLALYPRGHFGQELTSSEMSQLITTKSGELQSRVLASVSARHDARVRLLGQSGLGAVRALQSEPGEPQIVIWTQRQKAAFVEVTWGASAPAVSIRKISPHEHPSNAVSLQHLLGEDPEVAAFEGLQRDVEAELGCRLGAQSWGRPELVPAWAW